MKNYLLTVFFFVVATMAHAVIIQDFESIAKIWVWWVLTIQSISAVFLRSIMRFRQRII